MSTFKEKFNKKHGFPLKKSHSLADISKLTGYKLSGLKTIYSKGEGAFYSNPGSVRSHVKSSDQWAKARVYASVHKGSKSYNKDKMHLTKSSAPTCTPGKKAQSKVVKGKCVRFGVPGTKLGRKGSQRQMSYCKRHQCSKVTNLATPKAQSCLAWKCSLKTRS